jgi:hypothetical protein
MLLVAGGFLLLASFLTSILYAISYIHLTILHLFYISYILRMVTSILYIKKYTGTWGTIPGVPGVPGQARYTEHSSNISYVPFRTPSKLIKFNKI